MKAKLKIHKEFFIFLLPLFFVLHGFVENFDIVPAWDAFQLFLFYVAAFIILNLIFFLIFKSWRKASLFVFFLMAIHFFFGSFHDNSKKIIGNNFFTSYTFILPVIFLLIIFLFIYIKRRKTNFDRTVRFLNLLFLIFCCLDFVWLFSKILTQKHQNQNSALNVAPYNGPNKPDVYLIIADEYAGFQELKDIFHFDNSDFENALQQRGFHVVKNPKSNYNFTPFSVASILNYSFLSLADTNHTAKDIHTMMEMIRNNAVCKFFKASGYKIFNNSFFDIQNEPTKTTETFLPLKTTYITSQTLLSRLNRDIAFNLVTRFHVEWFVKDVLFFNKHNNELLINTTLQTSKDTVTPKFSYTHLMMPHNPFYFNENGKENDYKLLFRDTDKTMYLSYLKYSNKKFLSLIDSIQKNSIKPPIIIFMSDHGFRQFKEWQDYKYYFMNNLAIYLPDKNYSPFYDGISAVNVFRALFNTEFNQHLPLLKDSTIFLKD